MTGKRSKAFNVKGGKKILCLLYQFLSKRCTYRPNFVAVTALKQGGKKLYQSQMKLSSKRKNKDQFLFFVKRNKRIL